MYLLTGFGRADRTVRHFLCVAALASFPTESVGIELLEDDRYLKRCSFLRELMEEELLYLSDLTDFVWRRFAFLIDRQAGDDAGESLRQSTLLAAHISAAYLYNDLFLTAQTLPLSLTQGCITSTLDELEHAPLPIADPIAQQLRYCMDLGVAKAELVRFLELVRDTAGTTNLIEQGFAVGKDPCNTPFFPRVRNMIIMSVQALFKRSAYSAGLRL